MTLAAKNSDQAREPHRRRNPLTGEWVLISPQRNLRPWQGATESVAENSGQAHEPDCYLCPRNTRVGGKINPNYSGPYVFSNDFPALLPNTTTKHPTGASTLHHSAPVKGEARVICYSPYHDKTMARLPVRAIRQIIMSWIEQTEDLSRLYRTVTIFENRGTAMGCSNPHPHGQIWATDYVPTNVAIEDQHQSNYYQQNGRNLLADLVEKECKDGTRVVFETSEWLCLVPFWAAWPFETLVLPKNEAARFSDLSGNQCTDLAVALKRLTTRYDNLFETDFPYSMGWHGAPGRGDARHWRLHAHFYPPLLRSATVRKFMVGFELLAEAQRDLTPEAAAAILRDLSDLHYSEHDTHDDAN